MGEEGIIRDEPRQATCLEAEDQIIHIQIAEMIKICFEDLSAAKIVGAEAEILQVIQNLPISGE